MKYFSYRGILLLNLLILQFEGKCQRYLADLDSSLYIKDTVRPILQRFENLRITGYMQPQFQVAQSDGAPSYAGGNFSQFSSSRFMLRRARIKIDYLLAAKNRMPKALFTFQIDATERGVIVRDMFIRLYETDHTVFAFTAGFFARPFGYEVNLGSSFRETPERGRMSQILMPGERDLGFMGSFDPLKRSNKLYHFKLDLGFFNGQGASGTTDFDSHKDLISRLTIKPYKLNNWEFGGGLSLLQGGWKNATKYVYQTKKLSNGNAVFQVDSADNNLGKSSPRHYYGADAQVKLRHKWGETEWRAEYWFGTQPGTFASTTNPGILPSAQPTYIRHFKGAFFYLLQNIINSRHQLLLKYDWYDPNIHVTENRIGVTGTNLSAADICFKTLGTGYAYYFNSQTKLILYYEWIKNEDSQLAGYTKDLKDNVFTCRLQFRF
ncbi:MAG: porin [Chitinophagaceae bacterium]|nr:porin [Chitinophagaceae bacterium]